MLNKALPRSELEAKLERANDMLLALHRESAALVWAVNEFVTSVLNPVLAAGEEADAKEVQENTSKALRNIIIYTIDVEVLINFMRLHPTWDMSQKELRAYQAAPDPKFLSSEFADLTHDHAGPIVKRIRAEFNEICEQHEDLMTISEAYNAAREKTLNSVTRAQDDLMQMLAREGGAIELDAAIVTAKDQNDRGTKH